MKKRLVAFLLVSMLLFASFAPGFAASVDSVESVDSEERATIIVEYGLNRVSGSTYSFWGMAEVSDNSTITVFCTLTKGGTLVASAGNTGVGFAYAQGMAGLSSGTYTLTVTAATSNGDWITIEVPYNI